MFILVGLARAGGVWAVVTAVQTAKAQEAAPSLPEIVAATAADQRETLLAGQQALFEGQQGLSEVRPP